MPEELIQAEQRVLEELERLGSERGPIEGWSSRLDERKSKVSEAVYSRVRADYQKRLADLEAKSTPLRAEARRVATELGDRVGRIEAASRTLELDLQELELRHSLGEISDAVLAERAAEPRRQLEERKRELEATRTSRERWAKAGGAVPAPAEKAAAAPPATAHGPAVPGATVIAAPPLPSATPPAPPKPALAGSQTLSPEEHARRIEITVPQPIPPPRPPGGAPAPKAPAPVATQAVTSPAPSTETAKPATPPIPAIAPAPSIPAAAAHTSLVEVVPPGALPPTAPSPNFSDSVAGGTVMMPTVAPLAKPAEAKPAANVGMASLVPVDAESGAVAGHPLVDENFLGRAPECQVRIEHPSVSRRHAVLRLTASGWQLQDLKAENGTWVNGERITERKLADGDRVNIGTVRFLFKMR